MIGQLNGLGGWYQYYAGLADKLEGRQIPSPNPNYLVYTRREPVGVVAAITPWNSPLLLMTWKLAPALAAGCTVVIKPSEHAPASTLGFAELIEDAGFPPGVVNVVTGLSRETGAALAGHPGVDKVAFTGSTATGRAVAHAAAENLNPVTLELGGKSPQVVFPDADLAAAANGIVAGVFAATGQTCMAGSRLIVHADVHDELVRLVSERASRIKLGDPNDPDTEMGPVANGPQYRKVLGYLKTAVDEGAEVACGGVADEGLGGYFVQPTVLTGVGPASTVVREEVFGPVLSAYTFTDEDEAVKLANDTPVRAGRLGLDQRRAPGPPGRGPDQGRHGLGQRLPGGRAERARSAVTRLGPGPGERHRRGPGLHREQVGLGRAQRRAPATPSPSAEPGDTAPQRRGQLKAFGRAEPDSIRPSTASTARWQAVQRPAGPPSVSSACRMRPWPGCGCRLTQPRRSSSRSTWFMVCGVTKPGGPGRRWTAPAPRPARSAPRTRAPWRRARAAPRSWPRSARPGPA